MGHSGLKNTSAPSEGGRYVRREARRPPRRGGGTLAARVEIDGVADELDRAAV